jgi:hypothetical protein
MSKDISERLAGLKEALKEGFEHTNPARVKMTPDESAEDKTKNLYPVSERDIKILKSTDNETKDLLPVSKRDLKKLQNEED